MGGDSNNIAFNQALGVALSAKQFMGEDAPALLFNISTAGWRQVLGTLIPDRLPIATPRFLYLANAAHFNAPPPIPDGFSLHFMDQSLKDKVRGDLPEAVQQVLYLRANYQGPDQTAFGYVAVHDQICVSWAMIDTVVGTHGEIGLETLPMYQQRGLGTALSGATIQYGLTHGLTDIHWDAVSYNGPSVRMAEKYGLQRGLEYDQNLIIFGQASYLANLAWDHLDRNKFQAVIEVCEQLLESADGQKYGHFLSGAAWAGLGDKDKALYHLNKALDHGWDSLIEMENCSTLKSFHGTAEWAVILAHIKMNIESGLTTVAQQVS